MSDPSNQDPSFTPRRDPETRYASDSGPSSTDPGQPAVTAPSHLLPAHATEDPGKRSRLRVILLIVVVLGAAAIIAWRVHSNHKAAAVAAQKAAAAASRPIPVQVSLVQQKTVPVFLSALGTVTAYNTVTVNTRVSGQLLAVNFQEGQAVRKGQVLLEIDPRPYQAAVDQAVGQLAKDQANLKDMQAEAQRYTSLYQAGVVSKEQQQLEVSNAGQAVGTIKADQAAIEAARVNLGYTRIVSPIDGVVGLRQVDPGNIVNSGQSTGLIIITQIHPIAVIFTLTEDQLPEVQQAMKGGKKLVVEAYDRSGMNKIASGTLLTIDNEIDTTTGTAKLKAVFDNKDGSLFPNQFVNVRLILRDRPNATVVPTAAIQTGSQGTFVFVVDPGPTPANQLPKKQGAAAPASASAGSGTGSSGAGSKKGAPRAQYHAESVPVHVDLTIGTNSVLTDGELKAGQQVIVDGAEKLVNGGNVSPQLAKAGSVPATSNAIGSTPDTPTTPPPPSGQTGGLPTASANGGPQQ